MFAKLFVFIFLITYNYSMIIFPFKTALNTIDSDDIEYNTTDFANDYYSQPAYTTIKIGNPSQEIKVLLSYNDCGFKIGKSFNCIYDEEYLSHYNRNSSNDFKYTNLYNKTYEFKDGRSAEDSIYAYTDLELKNLKKFENIGFYLVTDTNDALCGIIGFRNNNFKFYCDDINNVFSSFKMGQIVNNKDWIIKYTSKDEGLLIFDPEMDKLYQNYDVNKLFITNSEKDYSPDSWTIVIDKVFSKNVNGSVIKKPQKAEINNDFGLLEGSGDYYYNITKTYFGEYIKKRICNLDELKVGIYTYFGIECDKTKFGIEDLKQFPTLSLQLVCFQTEFTLDYKDLFTETKHKYFFNFIFNKFIIERWVLGKPFLRKYPLLINFDSQTIGYYNGQFKTKPTDVIDTGTNYIFSEKFLIIIIIIIFILIIIAGVTCFFIGKRLNKIRKRKANELNDDFDYTSSNDNGKNLFDEGNGVN